MFPLILIGIFGGACAQEPVVNITWSQLDGVTELPYGDVVLGRVAEQTDTFCVGNLEVGIRILLDQEVENWKAAELDADAPDGENRFVVQHTGQFEPITGIFPSRFIEDNLLVLWKGEPAGGILPPYRDQAYPAYMITDFKEVFEGGEIYDILWVKESTLNW